MRRLTLSEARRVLTLLNDIATSDCTMGTHDIDALVEAREIVAQALGFVHDNETNLYVKPTPLSGVPK